MKSYLDFKTTFEDAGTVISIYVSLMDFQIMEGKNARSFLLTKSNEPLRLHDCKSLSKLIAAQLYKRDDQYKSAVMRFVRRKDGRRR